MSLYTIEPLGWAQTPRFFTGEDCGNQLARGNDLNTDAGLQAELNHAIQQQNAWAQCINTPMDAKCGRDNCYASNDPGAARFYRQPTQDERSRAIMLPGGVFLVDAKAHAQAWYDYAENLKGQQQRNRQMRATRAAEEKTAAFDEAAGNYLVSPAVIAAAVGPRMFTSERAGATEVAQKSTAQRVEREEQKKDNRTALYVGGFLLVGLAAFVFFKK